MNKIQKLSKFLKYIFYAGAITKILIPVSIFLSHSALLLSKGHSTHTELPISIDKYLSFSFGHKALVALSALPSEIMYSISLVFIAKLLHLYEKRDYFSLKTARYFGNIGKFFIFSVLVSFPQEILFSYVVTMNEPKGERFIRFSASNHDFSGIMFALMIILVGWVMKEAVKIKCEQDLTV